MKDTLAQSVKELHRKSSRRFGKRKRLITRSLVKYILRFITTIKFLKGHWAIGNRICTKGDSDFVCSAWTRLSIHCIVCKTKNILGVVI